jgi:hypothetical protein
MIKFMLVEGRATKKKARKVYSTHSYKPPVSVAKNEKPFNPTNRKPFLRLKLIDYDFLFQSQ